MRPVVMSLWWGLVPVPDMLRLTIEAIAEEEADRHGVCTPAVIHFGKNPRAVSARRQTMIRVLHQTKCGISGLARTWGCSRRTVQKTLGDARFDFARVAAE